MNISFENSADTKSVWLFRATVHLYFCLQLLTWEAFDSFPTLHHEASAVLT